MTEAELWELLNAYNTAGMTALALYFTVVSSFLIVAYLAGSDLTKYQAIIISGLFVIFAGLFTYGTIGYFERALYFTTRMPAYTDSTFRMNPAMPPIIGTVQCIGIITSLIFLWQVRRSKKK